MYSGEALNLPIVGAMIVCNILFWVVTRNIQINKAHDVGILRSMEPDSRRSASCGIGGVRDRTALAFCSGQLAAHSALAAQASARVPETS